MATPVKRWAGHNANRVNDAITALSIQELQNNRILERVIEDPRSVTTTELGAALGLTTVTLKECRIRLSEIKADKNE